MHFHIGIVTVSLTWTIAACAPSEIGPASTEGPSDSSASRSPGSDDSSGTGTGACPLAVGDGEPPEADPDGCLAAADEPACLAKDPEKCMPLRGVPATCGDGAWCVPDADASTYLGCRPFVVCKPHSKVVCALVDDVVTA